MERATLIYCACGYRLWCEVRCEGENLGKLVFWDHQGRLMRCRGCDEPLGNHVLVPK